MLGKVRKVGKAVGAFTHYNLEELEAGFGLQRPLGRRPSSSSARAPSGHRGREARARLQGRGRPRLGGRSDPVGSRFGPLRRGAGRQVRRGCRYGRGLETLLPGQSRFHPRHGQHPGPETGVFGFLAPRGGVTLTVPNRRLGSRGIAVVGKRTDLAMVGALPRVRGFSRVFLGEATSTGDQKQIEGWHTHLRGPAVRERGGNPG